ncbi:8-oxo-dGTP pyrophosphatase MutT (NUDIX family) [Microbacterium sp. AK009]|uniref:NUDIX domain-containing protein n=1 Tax=Microbacterium sp. AK009 TaxID=2723068 RepID=UPI0017C9D2C7|nr:NUDIX domain-containing protein [Microbacterium sp. AK009]NYF15911.1 8-oxo-dGTP pyrophosphatase MutT (NUDIX family) [Microbacterium sp. AK009]
MTASVPDEPGAASASAADRLARVLADASGQSRPRVERDGNDPDVPVAGTAVLLRDTARGPEVLMLERPGRGSFAGAWVFPGGKVEPGDAEGAGAAGEEAAARRAAARETREEVGLVLDGEALTTLSRWDPPPGLALRIRTWFFVAGLRGDLAAETDGLALADGEVVRAQWLAPGAALAAHGRGDLVLYPPTWVTLHDLVDATSVDETLRRTRMARVRRFDTVARTGPDGPILLWAEDAEFDAPGPGIARHRLEIGRLPWRYLRS